MVKNYIYFTTASTTPNVSTLHSYYHLWLHYSDSDSVRKENLVDLWDSPENI